jgi:hypothetical protein
MIKVGDKVVCINNTYKSYKGEMAYFTRLKTGEVYELEPVLNGVKYIAIAGYGFNLKEGDGSQWWFKDHFITLSEWRDRQIDKILEDG